MFILIRYLEKGVVTKYNILSHNIYYVNYIYITKPSYAGYVFGGHNLVTTS